MFTGIIGLAVAGKLENFIGLSGQGSPDSSFLSLFGDIFEVGIPEELVKAFPVAVLTLVFRKPLNAADILILAIFSGLGFAAYENAA